MPRLRVSVAQYIQDVVAVRQVGDVAGGAERLGDILRRLDAAHGEQTVTGLVERAGDQRSSLGLTLGAHNRRLTFLLGLLHNELGTLRILLRDLLLLNGLSELLAKREVGLGVSSAA